MQQIQGKNKHRAYKTRTSRYAIEHTKQEQADMQYKTREDIQQSIQNKNQQICNRAYQTRTSRYAIEHTKQEQADMEQSIQNKSKQIFNRPYKTKTSRYAIDHT